jgi:AmiR/NasT family two-component response regulator
LIKLMPKRSVPLIVVASTSAPFAEDVAARLRRDGSIVYVTHSLQGCLRVATSVAPDVVLLDSAFPPRLEELLHAHPTSARAIILHLSQEMVAREAPVVLHAA